MNEENKPVIAVLAMLLYATSQSRPATETEHNTFAMARAQAFKEAEAFIEDAEQRGLLP